MEYKLASLLRIIAYAQIDVDLAKHFVLKTMNSDPKCAFKLIDSCNRDVISSFEVSQFLERHKIPVEQDEVRMIVQYYDLKRTGKLDFEAFQKALTPRNKNIEQSLAHTKQKEAKRLEDNLVNFFVKELELIRKAHDLRIQLHGTVGTHSFSFNRALDQDDKAVINYYDLDRFLQKQGIILSDTEISSILERGDRFGNGVMTYQEFETFILPDVVNKKVLAEKKDSQHLYNTISDRYTTKNIPTSNEPTSEPQGDYLRKTEMAIIDGRAPVPVPDFGETKERAGVKTEPLYSVVPRALPSGTPSGYHYTSQYSELDKYYRPSRDYYTTMFDDYERSKKYITGDEILKRSPIRGSSVGRRPSPGPHLDYEHTYPYVSKQEPAYNPPYHYEKYPYVTPVNPDHSATTATSSVSTSINSYPYHMYTHQPTIIPESHATYSTTYRREDLSRLSPNRSPSRNGRNRDMNISTRRSSSSSGHPAMPSVTYKVYDRFPDSHYLSDSTNVEHFFNYRRTSPSKMHLHGGTRLAGPTYQSQIPVISAYSRTDGFNKSSLDTLKKTANILEKPPNYPVYEPKVNSYGSELYGRYDLKRKVETMIKRNKYA